MKRMVRLTYVAALTLLVGRAGTVAGDVRTWEGAVSADWFEAGNWVEDAVPVAGDDVTIGTGKTALLTNGTPALTSLSLTGTLVFTNWNTMLSATHVTINSGGVMTLPPAFVTAAMSNKVFIVCSNLTVAAGGRIDADGKGWAGGLASQSGSGPGRGKGSSSTGSGAGHGGYAMEAELLAGGAPYGDAAWPYAPGSGGGGGNRTAGAGGGAVRIEADGVVTVNGTITANGVAGVQVSYGGGGGSGGSIFIRCRELAGSVGGRLSVNGGDGWYLNYSTAGGGGRIAVHYDTAAQGVRPPVVFQALPGKMGSVAAPSVMTEYRGEIGTLWFSDSRFLESAPLSGFFGEWRAEGLAAWEPGTLAFSNVWIRFVADGFRLNVAGDLTGTGPFARLEVGGGTLHTNVGPWRLSSTSAAPAVGIGGSLRLSGGATLALYNAPVAAGESWGSSLLVTNTLTLEAGSALLPFSHPTAGGPAYIAAHAVQILAGAKIDASAKGYGGAPIENLASSGFGPGAGTGDSHSGTGGGNGGFGGGSYFTYLGGREVGSPGTPTLAGSGGGRFGNRRGSPGGGSVILLADSLVVNGEITAQGGKGHGSGGAGGAIRVTCGALHGTNGTIRASGGDSSHTWSGGGGGGRIAITCDPAAQAAAGVPGVAFDARPGVSGGELAATYPRRNADLGTLWFSEARLVTGWFTSKLAGHVCGFPNWAFDALVVDNTWIRFGEEGVTVTVTNDATVLGATGRLDIGGSTAFDLNGLAVVNRTAGAALKVGGDLVVSNGASLRLFSAETNGAAFSHGVAVEVGGTMIVATNSWVMPHSHPVNGGSPKVMVNRLVVAAGGGFNANELGWGGSTNARTGGHGPGGGAGTGPAGSTTTGLGCAGGYGGRGGGSYYRTAGGLTYGNSNAPAGPGSGGVPYQSARGLSGGGLIWVEAAGNIVVDGALTANSASGGGPGSGGGIYLRCRRFGGAGRLQANGGGSNNSLAAGGGGGRIAVWRMTHSFTGSASAANGAGSTSGAGRSWEPGGLGSVVWGPIPPSGTVLLVR